MPTSTGTRGGELVPVLAKYWVDRNVIVALWPESRRGSPNVKAFIAFLAEIFQESPSWNDGLSGC
jgi:DNA-binding transcriptional LysR family regulator